ncbi:hypothetical protein ABNF97_04445 [Plantactinospora sp. B6F1]|uniref:hypothetical protein n=1 Tax=Plantactinospora sp. B6F1 TaxID=3158971 RepID=UPI00102C80FB
MVDVSWKRDGGTPWLLAPRVDGPTFVGVTFAVGLAHQPTEQLGVLALLGAWLTGTLTRPAEAVDRAGHEPLDQVEFVAGQADSSLLLVGSAAAVVDGLHRVERLLAAPPEILLDDGLRERASLSLPALAPWTSHLVARWPGYLPQLAALGPLAVGTLDGAAVADFARTRLGVANRVYWTNGTDVPTLAGNDRPAAPGAPALPPLPVDAFGAPRCVLQRSGELFSIAPPATPAVEVALSMLADRLHRRLVVFEPLATEANLSTYPVGDDRVLVCGAAAPVTGKEVAAGEAALQTVLDLTEATVSDAEVERFRRALADAPLPAAPHEPAALRWLARRHLHRGDHPTPQHVADEYRNLSDDAVRDALRGLRNSLIYSVPGAAVGEPPFPLAERTAPEPATGRRFRDRVVPRRAVVCSPTRIGVLDTVVEKHWAGPRRLVVTTSSVAFDQIVLLVHTGDQATSLVDRQLSSVSLTWGAYRAGQHLRRMVDARTVGVPAIRRPPNPAWAAQVAGAIRKRRRDLAITATCGGVIASVLVGALVASGANRPEPAPRVSRTVDPGTVVSLPNGTMVAADQPELIVNLNPETPYAYAVRVRMCGGSTQEPAGGEHLQRNYFGFDRFGLTVGEAAGTGFIGLPGRPIPHATSLDHHQCGTAWLAYRVGPPDPARETTLRYTNLAGDRVTWRMPATPPRSTLSRPCPTPGGPAAGPATPVPCPS